jgi:hypothetical protein
MDDGEGVLSEEPQFPVGSPPGLASQGGLGKFR